MLPLTVVTAILVTLVHGCLYQFKLELTPIPFSLMGRALAIWGEVKMPINNVTKVEANKLAAWILSLK